MIEISYRENKGLGEICHLIVGKDTVIKPTGEAPPKTVHEDLDINELAGDLS